VPNREPRYGVKRNLKRKLALLRAESKLHPLKPVLHKQAVSVRSFPLIAAGAKVVRHENIK
jgi:hypothetical protein